MGGEDRSDTLELIDELETAETNETEVPAGPPVYISDLKSLHVSELLEMGEAQGLEGAQGLRKHELVFALLRHRARQGGPIHGDGTLELMPDGFGFLRSADSSCLTSPDDIYVSPAMVRRFNLRTGDTLEGVVHPLARGSGTSPSSGSRRSTVARPPSARARSCSRTSPRCIHSYATGSSANSGPRRTSPAG
jgi:hypothetical protein